MNNSPINTLKALTLSFLLSTIFTICVSPAFAQKTGDKLDDLGAFYKLSDGNFLNVRIVNFRFKVFFTDPDKKVIEPLYDTLIVKFDGIVKKKEDGQYPLSKSGNYLTSSRRLKKPYQYWIRVFINDPKAPDGKLVLPRIRLHQ